MKAFIPLLVGFVAVVSAGDVWVLKSPKGFQIDTKFPMKQNDVASFLFRSFGVSETADNSWPGLVQKNPFSTSRRAIVVAVPSSTADKDQLDLPGDRIPLASAFNPEALVYTLNHPLTAVFGARAGVEIIEQAAIPVKKGVQIPPNTLNASQTPVSHFVDELSAVAALPSVVFNSQSPAKAFVYEFETLDGLGKREDVAEGRRLLSGVLRNVADESDATVLVVTYVDSMGQNLKTRTKRQAPAGGASSSSATDENDYTVPMNLILWLSLALFFITMAVCIGIGSMDPGWDSIIYRMTNQRMKKDN